jgi:hypothetical protein
MIDSSNNWATNRLIDYVGGFGRINDEIANLGLVKELRLQAVLRRDRRAGDRATTTPATTAGRLSFANRQVAVYAVFVDEGTTRTSAPQQNVLDCVVMHTVRQHSGVSTGADVPPVAAANCRPRRKRRTQRRL